MRLAAVVAMLACAGRAQFKSTVPLVVAPTTVIDSNRSRDWSSALILIGVVEAQRAEEPAEVSDPAVELTTGSLLRPRRQGPESC